MSSIVNKVKDALHSDKSHEAPEGAHGPHSSRAANAADPRTDSDRDHRANPGTHTGGYTGTDNYTHGSGTTAGTGPGLTGAGYGSSRTTGYNDPEGTHGPHSSRLANAADPRVDSDADRSHGGNRGTHGTTGGGFGTTTGTGAGYGSSHTTGYNDPEGTHGPHSSRLANAADPRVDSDADRSHGGYGSNRGTHGGYGNTAGTGTFGTTGAAAGAGYGNSRTTGYNDPEGTHGPHSSRLANAADPRIDSDADRSRGGYGSTAGAGAGAGAYGSTGAHHGTHTGPGPAPNTAGPHKSDMANKIDPRVDSDLDGSKTMGGDRTYQ